MTAAPRVAIIAIGSEMLGPLRRDTNSLWLTGRLEEAGFTVVHELGLGLESQAYADVTPEEWKKVVKENARDEADGYFLSCTNTRMIEAIEDLERELDKPVINSNQATIWACLKNTVSRANRYWFPERAARYRRLSVTVSISRTSMRRAIS